MPSLSQSYRPRRFADVTGQQHVTETLRREVATGLLAHAYIFSGPRGVGKTTSARIFAQALNCHAPIDGEPCSACPPCQAFTEGRLMDVIELDAATHTGVDTIREAIIEHVRFAPTFGKAKVYILDEAHMLSSSSWNALLKTLEEPPAYAYFILATTEWHKIPATIISRCQRFEFKRIPDDVLAPRIRELAAKEGWKIDEEVVRLIVSRADGCVRDAETLLGQLGSLGEEHISQAVAGLVIPPTHLPFAAGLMEHWAARNHGAALSEARRLLDEGVGILPLFDDLLTVVRHLLQSAALPETSKHWEQGTIEERAMAPLLGRFSALELHDMALMLMERRKDIKSGVDPLFALELASTLVACGALRRDDGVSGAMSSGKPVTAIPESSVKMTKAPSTTPAAEGEKSVAAASSGATMTAPSLPREPLPPPSPTPLQDTSLPSAPVPEAGTPVSHDQPLIDISAVRLKWNAIVRAVDEKNHSLPFILKISQPEEIRGQTLVIRFQYPFHRDKVVTDVKNRRIVEGCVREVLAVPSLVIEGVVGEDARRTEERNQDMVANILKAFGGQVVEGN